MSKSLSLISNLVSNSPLKNPGDKLTAKVTKTGRKVITICTSEEGKYSATRYNNGTIVETRTTRPKT